MKRVKQNEIGSLALEQVLFIAAIVVMGAAVSAFYEKLALYFRNVSVPTVTSN